MLVAEFRQDRRRRRPSRGVLGQASRDEIPDLRRHVRQTRLLVDHAVDERGDVPRAPRAAARRRVAQQCPEAEHVTGRTYLTAGLGLLRRHVSRRADQQADSRQRGRPGGPGDAEVDDPRPVRRQQHVRRLQVPVHQADVVDRGQPLRKTRRKTAQLRRRQRPALAHHVIERRRVDVRRRQPRHRPLGIGVHHHSRVKPVHPPRRRDLPPEPGPELPVHGQLRTDHLHRHRPPPSRPPQEHPPHPAAAQHPNQPIRPDPIRITRLQLASHNTPQAFRNQMAQTLALSVIP